jgi:hypothetical protein
VPLYYTDSSCPWSSDQGCRYSFIHFIPRVSTECLLYAGTVIGAEDKAVMKTRWARAHPRLFFPGKHERPSCCRSPLRPQLPGDASWGRGPEARGKIQWPQHQHIREKGTVALCWDPAVLQGGASWSFRRMRRAWLRPCAIGRVGPGNASCRASRCGANQSLSPRA